MSIDPNKRHKADYEKWDPSPSGKNQWRCKLCGRITQGAERECYTVAMWFKDRRAAGLPITVEAFLRGE